MKKKNLENQAINKPFKGLFFALIITLLNMPYLSVAQVFNASLSAGFVTSQVDGDTYGGYHKIGLSGAAFISVPLRGKFTLFSGIEYLQKGSRKPSNPEAGDYETREIALHYVEIPLGISWQIRRKISLEAGVSIGYLISGKIKENGETVPTNFYQFKAFDYQLAGGVSYRFSSRFSFRGKFAYSLLPIFEAPQQFNNLLNFSLLYDL